MLTRNSADARNCYCLASYPSPPPPTPPISQNEPHPFHVKWDWEPPVQPSVALETFLEEVKLELTSIEFDKPKNNISTGERQALKELSRNKSIILKKSDKGKHHRIDEQTGQTKRRSGSA